MLTYKEANNVNYLVERSFTWVKNNSEQTREMRHDRAIVRCLKITKGRTALHVTPEVYVLSEDGRWASPLVTEFWPLYRKLPTGEATDGWRWQFEAMMRDYDVFPILLQRPIKVGQSWQFERKFRFPSSLEGWVRGQVTHGFVALEKIDAVECAKIQYSISSGLNTVEHPETLVDEKMKQTKPIYTAEIKGTAWFDPERGIVVKQQHHGRLTEQWTDRLDRNLAERYRHTPAEGRDLVNDIRTSHITAMLIPDKKATELIEEAKEAQQVKAGKEKATAEGKTRVAEKAPTWKYLVEETTEESDRLTEETKLHTGRAFIYYGAGARQADGQIRDAPQVVYIGQNHEPLPKRELYKSAFVPISSDRFSMIHNLPQQAGAHADFPVPTHTVLRSFELLPLSSQEELRKGANWTRTLYANIGWSKLILPITVEHKVKGYKRSHGRKCAVIEYQVSGEYNTDDHLEQLPEKQRGELRGEYRLKGKGTAYYDPAEDIIVEKEQTMLWASFGQKLDRLENDETGWVTTQDKETSVTIRVSLLEAGPFLPISLYVLILAAAIVGIAGIILLLRTRASSQSQ